MHPLGRLTITVLCLCLGQAPAWGQEVPSTHEPEAPEAIPGADGASVDIVIGPSRKELDPIAMQRFRSFHVNVIPEVLNRVLGGVPRTVCSRVEPCCSELGLGSVIRAVRSGVGPCCSDRK